jgi:hypothetical protein
MLIWLAAQGAAAGTAPAGAEFLVNVYTENSQEVAQACHDGTGNFVVAWESFEQDGDQNGIFARLFDSSGQPRSDQFQVNTYTIGDHVQPQLCCDSGGSFVVTWTDYGQDGGYGGIFAQRFTSGGQPAGTEFQVNSHTADDQTYPGVCCDGSGRFVVTWTSEDQDGSDDGIFSQRYDSAGQPSGQEFQVNTYTVDAQGVLSDVCCDRTGNFVVAWGEEGRDGDSNGIFAQRFSSTGAPLGTDFLVNTYTVSNQNAPALNCDDDGDFNVAWFSSGQDGDVPGVFARSFDSAGQPLHGEIQVNEFTLDSQSNPDVCCDGGGNFTVVWDSRVQDGSDSAAFARSFSRGGQPLTPEFQANTYTMQSQTNPAISCDSAGNFVVLWDSFRQDGHDAGVFAQIFQAMGGAPAPVPVSGAAGLALLVTALAGGGIALLQRRRRR